jgi:hypothetical protein
MASNAADFLPDEAAVKKAVANLSRVPSALKGHMIAMIKTRASALKMDLPKGWMGSSGVSMTNPLVTLAVPVVSVSDGPTLKTNALLSVTAKERQDADNTFPGTDKFPVSNVAQWKKAWDLRGNSSLPKAKVEAWLVDLAHKKGWDDALKAKMAGAS